MRLFKKKNDIKFDIFTEDKRKDVENAYSILVNILNSKKATKSDLTIAIENAIGHLGYVLDEEKNYE